MWSYCKKITGREWQKISSGIRCMSRGQSRSRNTEGVDTRRRSPQMTRNNFEVEFLPVSYKAQFWLARHQQDLSVGHVQTFYLRLKPWCHMSSLQYLMPYTKIKHWQIINYKDNFMRGENFIHCFELWDAYQSTVKKIL